MAMRLTYKSERMDITVDGVDTKAAYDELAKALEIFNETRCGACDSNDVQFVTRVAKGYTFREARCLECRCSLAFGLTKADMSMFPRRKDEQGNYLPNNGWVKERRDEEGQPF